MAFGQLIIGPPGSGKTTYCNGMQQYMQLIGRKVAVINLDPANDALPYDCTIDLADLVSLEAVMETYGLGPNGGICQLLALNISLLKEAARYGLTQWLMSAGLLYCMEFLEHNMDWLQERMDPLIEGKTAVRK